MRLVSIVLSILALSACGSEGSSQPARAPAERAEGRSEPEMRVTAGGLTWDVHEPLVPRAPENEMRIAEYGVRGDRDTVLAVFHFPADRGGGGDVQSNIDRWLGQFVQPDGRDTREAARIERSEVNDIPVTIVDARGIFVGRLGMSTRAVEQPGWRVLGAIAEGPQGPVFFKMLGPEEGVDTAEPAFEDLVRSIRAM
ncbi:MAG TPA: hypothetical protein VIL20_22625 [Sandaracinaceae bacterium]